MVARNNSVLMKVGPEMTQKKSGFSRIPWDVYARNKHAGLYRTEVTKKKVYHNNNGKFVKKLKNKAVDNGSFNRKCKRQSRHESFKAARKGNQTAPTVKILKRPRGYNVKNRWSRNVPVKIETTYLTKVNQDKYMKRKGHKSNWKKNDHVISELARHKFETVQEYVMEKQLKKVLASLNSYVQDPFLNKDMQLSSQQCQNKLRVLNEMIWGSEELKKKASKARSILIANQAFIQKDRVRQTAIERNWKEHKNLNRRKPRKAYYYPRVKKNMKKRFQSFENIKVKQEERVKYRSQVHSEIQDGGFICYFTINVPQVKQDKKKQCQEHPIPTDNMYCSACYEPVEQDFQFAAMATETNDIPEKKPSNFIQAFKPSSNSII